MRAALRALLLASPLALVGATCGEAVEVASLVANDWLAVTCANNPESYCEEAQALSLSLSQRVRELRLGARPQAFDLPSASARPLEAGRPATGPAPAEPAPASGAPGTGVEPPPPEAPPPGALEPLAVELAVVAESAGVWRPVEDGAPIAPGQEIRVVLRPEQRSFVYAFGVDGAGTITPLFPEVGAVEGNPVEAGAVLTAPAELAYRVDQPGVGHVYVVVADGPRDALESVRAAFLTRPRSVGEGARERVGRPTVFGLDASKASEEHALPEGVTGRSAVDTERYVGDPPEADLVITRWFEVG